MRSSLSQGRSKIFQYIPRSRAQRIVEKIVALRTNLAGDVKRLTSFTTEYRLRVGDYRILFKIHADKVIIYRLKHRTDAPQTQRNK